MHGNAGQRAKGKESSYLEMHTPRPLRVDTYLASKVRTFLASNCKGLGKAGGGGCGGGA
jgi:hypothetical protein